MSRFLHLLWNKLYEDDIFFVGSAVAFNLLIAAIPLVMLGIGLTAYVLSAQVNDPVQAIVTMVVGVLPTAAANMDPAVPVRALVRAVVAGRAGLTFVGALVFIWLGTWLVGTLRSALRRVFEVSRIRGIIHGKLFDAGVVMLGVVLLTLNLGVTITFDTAVTYGGEIFGLGGPAVSTAEFYVGNLVAVGSIWILFFIIYRFLPAHPTPWSVAFVGATFSALAHEALKQGFSWYATEVADFGSTWGNLATVALLLFWIYYEALVFILGGEIAQVFATMRTVTAPAPGSPPAPLADGTEDEG